MALARPKPVLVARGSRAHDGLFEPDDDSHRWLAFAVPDADDIVFWSRRRGEWATWTGRTFALGQQIIDEAATYSFGRALSIFASPLDWLKAGRAGIVILPDRWPLAFDRLRDAPRIAVAEELLPTYKRHMMPARMPELLVLTKQRQADL